MGEMLWVAIGLALLIVYVGNRIIRHLTPLTKPIKMIDQREDADFGIWISVNNTPLAEMTVGHVDDWECGVTFQLYGEAEIKPETGAIRGSIKIYSSLRALADTNQIGHGKLHEKSAELYVGLKPDQAAVLLNETRRGPGNAHAHGYIDSKGSIRVTYFSFATSP